MSQRFSLYDDLTVEENIEFYSGIYGVPASKKQQREDWVIEMAGLESFKTHLTRTLSAGYQTATVPGLRTPSRAENHLPR